MTPGTSTETSSVSYQARNREQEQGGGSGEQGVGMVIGQDKLDQKGTKGCEGLLSWDMEDAEARSTS